MAYKDDLMLNADEMLVLHKTIKNINNIYGHKIDITADPCGFFEGEVFKKLRDNKTIMCPCAKTMVPYQTNGIVRPCEIANFMQGM